MIHNTHYLIFSKENKNPSTNFLSTNLKKNHPLSIECLTNVQLKHERAIVRSIEYIQKNLSNNLSIQKIAKVAFLSEFYFLRLFTEKIGLTPHQFVMKSRLKKAIELLQNTNTSINCIAHTVGYSHAHFSKLFKDAAGVTPLEFRINYRKSLLMNKTWIEKTKKS